MIDREPAPSETIALRPFDCAGGLEQRLASDRKANAADAPVVDVPARPQIGDRSVEITLGAPSEDVRIAVALALAAPVEEQNAVAVSRQHARGLL